MTSKHDAELQQHAVQLVLSGKSGAQVDLGIPTDTLSQWVQDHRREHPYPFLRSWHTMHRDRDRRHRHALPGKSWPAAWTSLDEFYGDGG